MKRAICWGAAVAFALGASLAQATDAPFTETFDANDANWGTSTGGLGLTYIATGGADGGGYVADTFDVSTKVEGDSVVAFRAQDELNSSDHAFEGNWIADGVTQLKATVRHDGPEPMFFFTRIASSINFPGATGIEFTPVPPNVWTDVTFDISAANPQFVTFEGSNFASVFSNVGHVQLGFDVPAGLAGSNSPVTVDLDQVALVVPEPLCTLPFVLSGLALLERRRRK
ncbi:MAG: hypothetical protein KDA60_16810 [Planctomycetales bacterium]|nr:hypothetical protein [Planctomycetales bacterium]